MKELILLSVIILLIYLTSWLILAIILKRNDIVDIAWGLGYVVPAAYYITNYEIYARAILITVLVSRRGISIITASSPGFLYGILGPVTTTVLLLSVSGIPMLEEKYKDRPDFIEYKKRTSVFFPLPPRK